MLHTEARALAMELIPTGMMSAMVMAGLHRLPMGLLDIANNIPLPSCNILHTRDNFINLYALTKLKVHEKLTEEISIEFL